MHLDFLQVGLKPEYHQQKESTLSRYACAHISVLVGDIRQQSYNHYTELESLIVLFVDHFFISLEGAGGFPFKLLRLGAMCLYIKNMGTLEE